MNVAGLDAMRDELLASGLHVGYHDLDPFLGARRVLLQNSPQVL
jgi:hypothetical protein